MSAEMRQNEKMVLYLPFKMLETMIFVTNAHVMNCACVLCVEFS